MDPEAGYDEIWISKACHVQTAEQRFGPHVREGIDAFLTETPGAGEFDDSDDEDPWPVTTWAFQPGMTTANNWNIFVDHEAAPHRPEEAGFPRIARYRCNLTALSQRYDLYFAAYQDKIYVYRPQRAPRILPPPCLVLHPGRTRLSRYAPGHVDRRFAHQINHMTVGTLGDVEIVAFVYDDGDVAAYYTHMIVHHISSTDESGRRPPIPSTQLIPQPFFHDNVGISAWGLAIHAKSRLIAVSSNKHEVTVYAFALTRSPARSVDSQESERSPLTWSGQTALELEKHVQSRTRTWKIVLPLGINGNNIPSIAFVEDDQGCAEKVAAQDIYGQTWLLNIWKIGAQPTYCPTSTDRLSPRYKGWGVLILPESSFKHTKTVREALGVPSNELIEPGPSSYCDDMLDNTCSLFYIKQLAADPETVLQNRSARPGWDYVRTHREGFIQQTAVMDDSSSEDSAESLIPDSDDEAGWNEVAAMATGTGAGHTAIMTAQETPNEHTRWAALTTTEAPKGSALQDLSEDVQLRREIIPLFGETQAFDETAGRLIFPGKDRSKRVRPVAFSHAKKELSESTIKGLCIFRSTLTDLELVPLDKTPGLVCKYVLTFHDHLNRRTGPFNFNRIHSERINMLLHIPELCLVVAGSPCGRVALITLTKTRKKVHGGMTLKRGFRVDRVLPRKEEEDQRLRPWCELIGIAMSQVPSAKAGSLDLGPQSQTATYRLILHYLDHTILMYNIERTRDGKDDLLIF